jgi:hypothetical protein
MKIIEPKVELLSELDITPESHIARCARTCYGREYKEPNQEDGCFEAYFVIDNIGAVKFNATLSVETYHLASKEEREKVSKMSYSMFQNLIAVEEKLLK